MKQIKKHYGLLLLLPFFLGCTIDSIPSMDAQTVGGVNTLP